MDLNEFEWIFMDFNGFYFFLTLRWEPSDLEPMDLGVMKLLWNVRGDLTSFVPAWVGLSKDSSK